MFYTPNYAKKQFDLGKAVEGGQSALSERSGRVIIALHRRHIVISSTSVVTQERQRRSRLTAAMLSYCRPGLQLRQHSHSPPASADQ